MEPNNKKIAANTTDTAADGAPAALQTNDSGEPEKLPPHDAGAFSETSSRDEAERRARAIRTYHTDVAETVRRERVSLADIAIAEQERRETRDGGRDAGKGAERFYTNEARGIGERRAGRRFVQAGGLALFAVALAVLGYAGWRALQERAPVPIQESESVISTAARANIVTDGGDRVALIRELERAAAERNDSPDSIVELVVVRESAAGEIPLSGKELVGILAPSVDPAFARSIVGPAFIGIRAGDPNELFMIFSVDFYENAFAGMLRFEESAALDLPFLVREAPERGATTTAVTSAPVFADVLVVNRDARALVSGSFIQFIYSFPDTGTLVLAPSDTTLRRVFALLAAPRLRR